MGTLYTPASGLQLKKETLKIPWPSTPLRIQRVNYDELSTLFKEKLQHSILKMDLAASDVQKYVPISHGLPANRHLGYALQWFTMALAALGYYCVIQLRTWVRKID